MGAWKERDKESLWLRKWQLWTGLCRALPSWQNLAASESLCLHFRFVRGGDGSLGRLSYPHGPVQGRPKCPGDSLEFLQLICLKQPQHFLWGIWMSL